MIMTLSLRKDRSWIWTACRSAIGAGSMQESLVFLILVENVFFIMWDLLNNMSGLFLPEVQVIGVGVEYQTLMVT